MATVPTASEGALAGAAAADAWNKHYGNIADPVNLTKTARAEYARNELMAGDNEPGSLEAFYSGIDQAQGLAWRAVQAFSDVLDGPDWENYAAHRAEMNEEEAAKYDRMTTQKMEGFSDLGKWIHDTVLTQGPMMLPALAAGGLAAFAATAAGIPIAVGGAITLGAAFVPNYILNMGETYAKQIEAGGKVSAEHALWIGGVVAFLDTIVPGKILGRMGLTGKFSSYMSKNIAKGTKVGNQLKNGLALAVREGATEALQEAIMITGKNFVNDEMDKDFTKEEMWEVIEGFAAGMLLGGGAGLVTSAGTERARRQVAEEEAFPEAKEIAISNLKDETDAAVAAINEKGRKGERITNEDIKEIKK